jgi:hypothetical protein
MALDVVDRRLAAHRLASPPFADPAAAVLCLGAVQAQDYLGALWALGLRTRGAAEADVERALAGRSILRTWSMRGTLHFVPAADAGWMVRLLAPRALARAAARERQLGLDARLFGRARDALVAALEGGRRLTREAAYRVLEDARVPAAGQRGIHLLSRLAQEGLLCFGPRQGKQQTFVLLDEWVPPRAARRLEREEALAELARRYFTGHGPARPEDLAWWSGLAAADAREALALAAPSLSRDVVDGETFWSGRRPPRAARPGAPMHLLPPFDEWLVGYRERGEVLDPAHRSRVHALLSPIVVHQGRVVGTWRRALEKDRVVISATFFRRPGARERRALEAAAERYGRFLGRRAGVSVTS